HEHRQEQRNKNPSPQPTRKTPASKKIPLYQLPRISTEATSPTPSPSLSIATETNNAAGIKNDQAKMPAGVGVVGVKHAREEIALSRQPPRPLPKKTERTGRDT
ncbi:unnamed protein product, partial [Ectocarpus sp. 6 AP-2014]